MRAVRLGLGILCAICVCLSVCAVLCILLMWPDSMCAYRDQGVSINLLLELKCLLKHLVAQDAVYRVNYAGWLFVLLMPFVTFSTTPYTNSRKRMVLMLAAILFGYVLLNVWLVHDHVITWHNYETCLGPFGSESPKMHEKCKHHINIADGAANVFYLFFGWTVSMTYAGLWEVAWRIYYWRTIKRMKIAGYKFKGRMFSKFLIAGILAPWIAPWLIMLLIWYLCTLLGCEMVAHH